MYVEILFCSGRSNHFALVLSFTRTAAARVTLGSFLSNVRSRALRMTLSTSAIVPGSTKSLFRLNVGFLGRMTKKSSHVDYQLNTPRPEWSS